MRKLKASTKFTAIVGLLFMVANVYAQDPNLHIYLSFGQSNMQGDGIIQAQDRTVDDRFQVFQAVDCPGLERTKGEWYAAVPPTCRCNTGLSPVDYFGRTMVANLPSDIRIGIINVSVAGCKIELFDKDEYEDYVAGITETWLKNIIYEYDTVPYQYLVDIARMAQEDGVIKGILLHQGESNTGDNQWPAKVRKIYHDLMDDLNLNPDSIPLLAGEVVHAEQGGICASMNSIIARLPDSLDNSYVIPSRGCPAKSDKLHFNSEGNRMLGRRYAVQMLSLMGYTSVYMEAECADIGANWEVAYDENTSNYGYAELLSGGQASPTDQTDDANTINFSFSVNKDTTYYLYVRMKNPDGDSSSISIKINDENFVQYNETTANEWKWVKISHFDLPAGDHTLTIASSTDSTKIDKICIRNSPISPVDMGEEAIELCEVDQPSEPTETETEPDPTTGDKMTEGTMGYKLGQNFPNPFTKDTSIPFELPRDTYVSLKVFNSLGLEFTELGGKVFIAGKHTVNFNPIGLPQGQYFYRIIADSFSATKQMVVVN